MVFSLSITPKQWLHHLFAGHEDMAICTTDHDHSHFTKAGYQCDCNNLVATSPYTPEPSFIIPGISLQHSTTYQATTTEALFSSVHSFFELRGPPATIGA